MPSGSIPPAIWSRKADWRYGSLEWCGQQLPAIRPRPASGSSPAPPESESAKSNQQTAPVLTCAASISTSDSPRGAPTRQQLRGVAAADIDDVLRQNLLPRQVEGCGAGQVAGGANQPGKAVVKAGELLRIVVARGADEADAGARDRALGQHEIVKRRIGLMREAAGANRNYPGLFLHS